MNSNLAETSRRAAWQWSLAIITAIGVALRIAWLRQPMRYDESTTYLESASAGFHAILTEYGPNNHVLHTLLVHLCTLWTSAEWAIRLPALIAGVALIPLTAWVGCVLFNRTAALLGAALVACSGHLIEYSTNARGYSMVAAFTLLQIAFASGAVRSARRVNLMGFALVTALGFFTIPTMLYPTATTIVWAALLVTQNRHEIVFRRLAKRVVLYAAICGLLTCVLYLPILLQPRGWHNLTGNRWVAPIESGWGKAVLHMGGELIGEWSLGLTRPGFFVAIAFAVLAVADGMRRRDTRAAWPVVAIVVCVALMFVQHVAPFARVFSFGLPMLCLFAGAGVALLVEKLPSLAPMIAPAALCGGLALYVAIGKVPDRSSSFDKFPPSQAALKFILPKLADGNTTAIFGVVASSPMRYACLRANQPRIVYQAGAHKLLIITRFDDPPEHVLAINRLQPGDFTRMRLIFRKGVARIYELTPIGGYSPRAHRTAATQTS